MAEGPQLLRPPVAVWLQPAGMVLAAVGIAVSVVDAAEHRWATSEEAAKDAAWMRTMEAEVEKVRP